MVEAEMEQDDVVVFAGFTLGWITRGTCEFTVFPEKPVLHILSLCSTLATRENSING